ncbi:MAG TPA: cytochrome C oxidase Cbb3, partial [Campylobacteraceae bacterium]|nr:cytochrome C oxidase Cbb3 [Campylobacteraceae bacterium]
MKVNLSSDTVNQLALLGAAAIIILTVYVAGKYIRQMKTAESTGELSEENWDGIGEYKNPVPTGWIVSFLGTMIWGLWYWFIGYPLNAYSQIGEYNEEVKTYNAEFEKKWQNPDKETLMAMGEGVFLVQ